MSNLKSSDYIRKIVANQVITDMSNYASALQDIAWYMYCEETAGSMDVRDSWEELPLYVQELYLDKAENRLEEIELEQRGWCC